MVRTGIGINHCPQCNALGTSVFDSRVTRMGRLRRKECKHCDHRWSTIEVHLGDAASMTTAIEALGKAQETVQQAGRALAKIDSYLGKFKSIAHPVAPAE